MTDSRIAQMTTLTGEMSESELREAFRALAGRSDRTPAGRMAKSFVQQELEARNPELRALTDAWSEDLETNDIQDDVVMRYLDAPLAENPR